MACSVSLLCMQVNDSNFVEDKSVPILEVEISHYKPMMGAVSEVSLLNPAFPIGKLYPAIDPQKRKCR